MPNKKLNKKNSILIQNDTRKTRGKIDEDVLFPIAPAKYELPKEYAKWLAELKTNIAKTRLKVVLASNSAMILLYWDIGKRILDKQVREGWGAKIIDRLAFDLRKSFPDMKGF